LKTFAVVSEPLVFRKIFSRFLFVVKTIIENHVLLLGCRKYEAEGAEGGDSHGWGLGT
jgi:hypothetical protein